jgi:soluble lytic murein transglycosylase-like protein
MVRVTACGSAFAFLALAALAQPASASWLFDDGVNAPSARGVSRHGERAFLNQAPGEVRAGAPEQSSAYSGLVAQYASANGIPASLVHRVIMRESRYNPRAVSMGNYGMMQIRLGTARAMGYTGSAAGLLDAETNMTYAVRYLAGAYRAAHGNESLAVALYARGYNARPYNGGTTESSY